MALASTPVVLGLSIWSKWTQREHIKYVWNGLVKGCESTNKNYVALGKTVKRLVSAGLLSDLVASSGWIIDDIHLLQV
jgi:hypothetical protein